MISALLNDKSIKSKAKTEMLSTWVLEHKISVQGLVSFAETAKDPLKATCIEALEQATKQHPELLEAAHFHFVTECLKGKAPRVKWESARVIGNVCKNFTSDLETAIINLLDNTEHEGTVVRWSAAFALGEILKLKTRHNDALVPAIESICDRETQNSIRKIYLAALKKIQK